MEKIPKIEFIFSLILCFTPSERVLKVLGPLPTINPMQFKFHEKGTVEHVWKIRERTMRKFFLNVCIVTVKVTCVTNNTN